MKNLVSFLAVVFFTLSVNAQFTISGQIKNFADSNLMVRIFKGADEQLVNKVKTDANGKFSVNIPEKYSGLVHLTDHSRQASIEVLTNNENVSLTATYQNGQFFKPEFSQGKTAMGFDSYQTYQSYNDLRVNVFPIIKALYTTDDEFFKALTKEEDRIVKMSPVSDLPLLKYYTQVNELANANVNSKNEADIYKNKILHRLVNDNNFLEGTGFLSKLVLDYLRYSIFGATDQNSINTTVEKEIDFLLEKTDIETPRGQNVLSAVFMVLPKEQFGSMLTKYYSKVDALTCEITDELRTSVSAHNMTKPGSVVPNIVFDKPIKGYKSLYDVKADKKIVFFWASWCPACRDELPFVKEYYENFKKEGGEIIAISLDYEDAAFKEAIKGYDWINYTELLQWETQGVSAYGVTSTPTLFLIDKDNKLIKQVDHISKLVEL